MKLLTYREERKLQLSTRKAFGPRTDEVRSLEPDVHVTVHRDEFLIINQLDAPISQIYFGMKLYMFRTVPLSIIRSFSLYAQQ